MGVVVVVIYLFIYLFVHMMYHILSVVTWFQTAYKVTAFATAEEYHLESLATEASNYGYVVVQLPEGNWSFNVLFYLFFVLHIAAVRISSTRVVFYILLEQTVVLVKNSHFSYSVPITEL